MKSFTSLGNSFNGNTERPGQFSLLFSALWHELMKRRVEETECHGQSVHRLECAFHVLLYKGEQLVDCLPALNLIFAEDHLAEDEERLL